MAKILGIPRNAAIAVTAILISGASLALAFLIPWPNTGDAEAPTTSDPTASINPLDPTRITVNFDGLNQQDAILAFADQTSLPAQLIGRSPVMPPPMSMHLKNSPLLEGYFQLLKGTETAPNEFTSNHMTFYGGATNMQTIGRWSVSGPFAVSVTRIERTRTIGQDPAQGVQPSQTMLIGQFYAEPKSRVTQFPDTFTFDEFTDDKRQTITITPMPGSTYIDSNSMPRATFQMMLNLPPSPGQRIAVMRGSTQFTIASKVKTLKTSDPTQEIAEEVGDLGIEITPILPANGPVGLPPSAAVSQNLQIRYHRNQMEQDKWNKMRDMLQRCELRLYNSNDERLPNINMYLSAISNDMYTFRVSYGGGTQQGDPHHLQLDIPSETRDVPVKFEFKDLQLP